MTSNNNDYSVINYVKSFLDSQNAKLMQKCFDSIRDNENKRYFKNFIPCITDEEFDSLYPLVTAVILTANKIECDSLNYIAKQQKDSCLKKRKHALPIFGESGFAAPEAYIFKLHSEYILHLKAYETGSNTPGGSTDLVRFIANNVLLKPSYIVSFGICYGRNPNEQDIGDVLIPKKLYPWSIGQKINEKNFSIKHDNFNLWLEDKFSESGIYSILDDFCDGNDGRRISDSLILRNKDLKNESTYNFSINVTWGNMSTGEAVISSQDVKDSIQKASRIENELGGEMEGYGIAKECIYYAKIPCFIIKAICDWGSCKDIDKKLKEEKIKCPPYLKDQFQCYAAFCAGIALIQLLNNEKEHLLSLHFIEWMCEAKRKKNQFPKYGYTTKNVILNNLKKYFNTDKSNAEKILDTMINQHVILRATDCRQREVSEQNSNTSLLW